MGRIWDRSAAHKRGNAIRRLAGAVLFAVCALCCQQVAAQARTRNPHARVNEKFRQIAAVADRADVASLLT
jgi:hypothetical protein